MTRVLSGVFWQLWKKKKYLLNSGGVDRKVSFLRNKSLFWDKCMCCVWVEMYKVQEAFRSLCPLSCLGAIIPHVLQKSGTIIFLQSNGNGKMQVSWLCFCHKLTLTWTCWSQYDTSHDANSKSSIVCCPARNNKLRLVGSYVDDLDPRACTLLVWQEYL